MSYSCSDYNECSPIIREFLFYMLTVKGRSPLTVENYYLDLRVFFRFIKQYKKISDATFEEITIDDVKIDLISSVTLSDVYEFLNYINAKRSNNARTRSRKICAIRMFYKYLVNNVKLIKENPVEYLELPSTPKSLPKHLSLEQSLDLLNAFNKDDPFYLRDFCIVTLFLNCGMRLSELTGLNLSSVNQNTLQVIGKGNKERQLYLNDACLKALDDYMKTRSKMKTIVDKEALFLNHHGKRIGQRWVQKIVTKLLDNAGLSGMGLSTHKLRHTAATLMYQYGEVDIRVLQEILGHSNLNTTQIYTHVASKQQESAIASNPLAKFKSKK